MRFNQRDIWHGTLALAIAQNRYQYCLNDPQNLYDYSGQIIGGRQIVLTPPRTIIKAADAKKRINTAAAIKAIIEQQRIDALSDSGIDTRGYSADMKRIVENTEQELRRRARAGTLTEWDRKNLIATACNTVQAMKTWEQLKDPNYWKRSWDIAWKGDYAEDFTGAGLASQVGVGMIPGVGQAADLRDIWYAVTHTEDNTFWGNVALIGLSFIGLIPIAGDLAKGLKGLKYLKYADEAADIAEAAGDIAKQAGKLDEVVEGASNISKLSSEEAEEIAFNAIKGKNSADSIVLGKYGDGGPTAYTNVAKSMDAQYFQLDNWEKLASQYDDSELWKINEKFLDIETSSGRDILLSHNPFEYWGGSSFYSREINYLVENGYEFIKEGDVWRAIR